VQIRRATSVFAVLGMTAASFLSGGSASAARTPPAPSSEMLTTRLLVAKNLPSGWRAISSAGFSAGLPPCLAVLYKKVPDQRGVARRTFSTSNDTTSFQDRLVSFGGQKAETRTTRLEKTLSTCNGKFGGVSYVARPLKFSSIGRQSGAFLVTLAIGSFHLGSAVIALARRGDTVVVVTYTTTQSDKTVQGKRFAQQAINKAG
jgi:hypothetical protein